jgi:hypothetical protein
VSKHTTHSVSNYALDVAKDVDGMAASQLDVGREAKVFTNHHSVSDADCSGERFIVSVSQTEDNLTIRAIHAFASESKAAEVALTTASKRMFFLNDSKTDNLKSFTNERDKRGVTDRLERVRCVWSFHAQKSFEVYFVFCDD